MKREEERAERYQTFEDLDVYRVARDFRKAMYRVAKQLPETEKFGLVSQVRRAAVSLPIISLKDMDAFIFSIRSNSCSRLEVHSRNCWMI